MHAIVKYKLTDFEKEVLRLTMYSSNEKTFIPMMNNLFDDKKYAFKILKKFIPTDTGLEFEIGSDNVDKLRPFIRDQHSNDLLIDSSFEITLRVRSFWNFGILMKLFEKMNQYCRIPDQGGIHIHTNVENHLIRSDNWIRRHNYIKVSEFVNFTNQYNLHFLQWLNDEIFQYRGTYNAVSAGSCKSHILNLRTDLNTFEFRGINITFDRATMIKYIIIAHLSKKYLTSSFFNSNFHIARFVPEERRILIREIMEL